MIIIAGSSTITLRNPDFNDVQRLDTNDIFRHSRGGTPLHYRSSLWPRITSRGMTITRLTQAKMQEFRDLMITDAGKEFTISRIDGVYTLWTHVCYILTPIFDIIRVRPPCSYDISFELQVKVTSP